MSKYKSEIERLTELELREIGNAEKKALDKCQYVIGQDVLFGGHLWRVLSIRIISGKVKINFKKMIDGKPKGRVMSEDDIAVLYDI